MSKVLVDTNVFVRLSALALLVVLPVACEADTAASAAADAGGDRVASVAGSEGVGGNGGGSGSSGRSSGGGASGGGGGAHTGGAPASGGASSGGATGSGGVTSSAGTSGSGGAIGAGGTAASGGSSGFGGVKYTTDFDLTEAPLSESRAWHHDGLDWTKVDSANGIAYGTQALGVTRSGPTGYDDSYAYLSGFPPDQQARAVVHLGSIDGSCTHEVEIILRWADSAHDARGYECNVAFDGSYAQIVRWNGPVGDYTYLKNGNVPGGIHDGDTVSASVVGDQITLSVNGVVRATATDATFATGNPGIAFWRGMSGCGSLGDYGFTQFTASSIGP